MIFHDGLKAWWEKEAQQYLHQQHGFRDRQLRPFGNTNSGTIYKDCVVGNSPELCRGLDSHGFSDLENSIKLHVHLTRKYANNDPTKFDLSTPASTWSAMTRCWEVAPTSARIVQDVSKFEEVLER